MARNTGTVTTVVSVFGDRQDAVAAISALHCAGFTSSEVGVLKRNLPAETSLGEDTWDEDKSGENEWVGPTAEAGIGGLFGAGVLAGVIPVIGPALFAGTLRVVASNVAGGAAVAGLIGALTDWGVSSEDAIYFEREVMAGRTIVTVESERRCDEIRAIFTQNSGSFRSKREMKQCQCHPSL